VVFVLLNRMVDDASNGCRSIPLESDPQALSGVHRTTRPFDRPRGCYVGDPLAVADPWPGPTESGLLTALADPATSRVLAE